MATETYKYFQATTQYLRTDYAPANTAILMNGDSVEPDPATLTMRHIENKLNLPTGGTDRLFVMGQAVATFSGNGSTTAFTLPFTPISKEAMIVKFVTVVQAASGYSLSGNTLTFTSAPPSGTSNVTVTIAVMRVSDLFYTAISGYLASDEAASVTSSAPSGFVVTSSYAIMNAVSNKISVFIRGDSISAGTLTTSPSSSAVNAYPKLGIELISGEVLKEVNPQTAYFGQEMVSKSYALNNFSIGSSSWDNSVNLGMSEDVYPRRETLAYAQRTRTLAMQNCRSVFMYWLGTNDISYDATVTGAIAYARAAARITQFRTDFPNVKLMVGTLIRRSTSSTLNGKLNDYNALLRANYVSAGVHVLCDFEANIPQMNISTGDTTNTTYYNTDGIHPTNAGQALLAPVFKNALLAAKALF